MSQERKKSVLAARAEWIRQMEAEEAALKARKEKGISEWSDNDFLTIEEIRDKADKEALERERQQLWNMVAQNARQVLADHPEYPSDPAILQRLGQYCESKGMTGTYSNILAGFEALHAQGLFVKNFSNARKKAREKTVDGWRANGVQIEARDVSHLSNEQLKELAEQEHAEDSAMRGFRSKTTPSVDYFEQAGKEVEEQRRKDGLIHNG